MVATVNPGYCKTKASISEERLLKEVFLGLSDILRSSFCFFTTETIYVNLIIGHYSFENITNHSSRKHSTGFTRAARTVCKLTVNHAMIMAVIPAKANTHHSSSTQ